MIYLFRTFLKIGSLSFGGFMALIAVMQKQVVEQDGKLDNQTLLDGISLAALLPGPVAVNTVGYVGYHMRGFWGAMISMFAVTLPCFLLVLLFSMAYFEYAELTLFDRLVDWVIPGVVAIIFTVGVNMSKKHLQDLVQWMIALTAFLLLQRIGGLWVTLLIMVGGATIGIIRYRSSEKNDHVHDIEALPLQLLKNIGLLLLCIGAVVFGIYLVQSPATGQMVTRLLLTFSSMSLTLFGGGYVIIPIIQETIVSTLQWVNLEEFNAALAISQFTPGPILISAAFVGFKMAGISGACLATVGIFLPSALLMISCSHVLHRYKNLALVKSIFKGLRPAVIGLIFSAAFTIASEHITGWTSVMVYLPVLVLALVFKLSSLWIMAIALLIGFLQTIL